jgi:polyisoprenyl-phosphate glycosyltransferase
LTLKSNLTKIVNYEVGRFLIIGSTTVIIDLVVYLVLLNIIFDTSISKAISFSVGAVFAYFANRSFTFKTSIKGFFRFIIFILLYLSTLFVNVVTNEIILNLIKQNIFSILIAFLIATSFSAGLNFLGMKYIVFFSSKS